MVQNIDICETFGTVHESIDGKVTPFKTVEVVIPVKSEDEPVSVEVNKPWVPYSGTRTLWDLLLSPIRSIRILFEIAHYNVDVRYASYKVKREEE